jgi:predicted GNAT superfamily acetyltransferase
MTDPVIRDATAADFPRIVALNAASARFHARWGFAEVGRQWLDEGRKQVSLQAADSRGKT